jgi:hypothetical protein
MDLLHHYTQIRRTGCRNVPSQHIMLTGALLNCKFLSFQPMGFMTACTDDYDTQFSCDSPLKCFHAYDFNCDRVPNDVYAERTRRI